jgi:hypothetical protein
MLNKVNKKIDTLIEIATYYEKIHEVIKSLIDGPGKTYFELFKTGLSFIKPLLTKSGKSK